MTDAGLLPAVLAIEHPVECRIEGRVNRFVVNVEVEGRRHMTGLVDHVRSGGQAAILFIVALPGVSRFKPFRSGDPEVYRLLEGACRAGVVLRSMSIAYDPGRAGIFLLAPDLPVVLQ